MNLEDYKFIENNYNTLIAINNSKSWGNVDLELKHRLDQIGVHNGWSYCNSCSSGFFRLVNLCLENYEKQRETIKSNKKVNKGKSKSGVSN